MDIELKIGIVLNYKNAEKKKDELFCLDQFDWLKGVDPKLIITSKGKKCVPADVAIGLYLENNYPENISATTDFNLDKPPNSGVYLEKTLKSPVVGSLIPVETYLITKEPLEKLSYFKIYTRVQIMHSFDVFCLNFAIVSTRFFLCAIKHILGCFACLLTLYK